jgi:hypothetical protein
VATPFSCNVLPLIESMFTSGDSDLLHVMHAQVSSVLIYVLPGLPDPPSDSKMRMGEELQVLPAMYSGRRGQFQQSAGVQVPEASWFGCGLALHKF